MSRYKLTYFEYQGLADLIRLLFVAGKVDFEDVRISFQDWPALKESKLKNTTFTTTGNHVGVLSRAYEMIF